MADYDLIAFVLVNQILEMNDADEEDWAELLKYNVLAIFPLEDWALLPMRGQLALASTIVGAKSLVNYDIAFQIMCAWEEVGGCYWVAQLELMRHAVMHTIRSQLSGPDQVNFDATELKDRIFSLLPVEPAKHVTHHILRLKLALLRADLLWLLDSMSASANPYEEFVHYYDNYKLHCFVPWFLSWSLNLLRTTEDCFPLLGQGATAMLHGQAQKYTGKTHIQEYKLCEDEEGEEEEMSDISVSHIDIEERVEDDFEAAVGFEKENNVVPEGVGMDPGGIPRIHLKRKFSDLSLTTVSPNPAPDTVNKPQRTREVQGRTLFATPPPMENYLYTSAPTTIVTHDEPTPGTESVYEGVDYSACMEIDEAAEDEANKENRPHSGDEACMFKKVHTVSATPNRLPCQDLRIVTDATELHNLTLRANNAHPTTIPNTTITTTAEATTHYKRPHTAAFDDDIVDSYTHFTNDTTPRETGTGPHYPLTSHTTCSSPNSIYSNTNSHSNSSTSDNTYVTSMNVDGPDSVLNHLVQSVWKIFTPASQSNATTTTTTTKQMKSVRVNRVASSASLEYSVTTAHTTV
eukprot:gene9733-11439_t